jgi:spore germination protein YaaH
MLVVILVALLGVAVPGSDAEAATRVRWGYYVGYDKATSLPSLQAHASHLNYVSPWYGYEIDASGNLRGSDDAEVTRVARSGGAKVVPLVQNSARYAEFHTLISSSSTRTRMARAISDMVAARGYDGVNVDFEGISPEDRPHLTSFMRELYALMHPQGKLVTMAVAAKTYDATTGWGGAYDYPALAPHADLFVVMAYDYHSVGSPPGPVAPVDWVRSVTLYARGTLGAAKLVVGLPLYGYDWNVTTGAKAVSVKHPQIAGLVRDYGARLGYDVASESATATYTKDGQQHKVWYENWRSFEAKHSVAREYGAAGVAVWRLGHEDPLVWNSLRGLYRVVDNATAGRFEASSSWGASTAVGGRFGPNYRFAPRAAVSDAARFGAQLPVTGQYAVYGRWPARAAHNARTPIGIQTTAGLKWVYVDQTKNGGRWMYLGTHSMSSGDGWRVLVSRWSEVGGYVVADAVKLLPH